MFRRSAGSLALMGCTLAMPALAHPTVISGPGFANTTQDVTIGVGHGCSGQDSLAFRITVPAGITGVRPMTSDFGMFSVEKDGGTVTSVNWQKPEAALLSEDLGYYKLVVHLKLPNQPFTRLFLPTFQTCKGADGGTTVVDWIGTGPNVPDSGVVLEPAPAITIVPPRKPGWNKFVVPVAIADLSLFFADALIVWKGTAAYSANPATLDQINATSGISKLTSLVANDEIWVKY